VLAAWAHVRPPVALDRMLEVLMNAAAPCALFALGVTVALRPLKRVPPDVPALVAIKLIVHPLIAWTLLFAHRKFRSGLGLYGGTDGIAPDRAQRLRDGEAI